MAPRNTTVVESSSSDEPQKEKVGVPLPWPVWGEVAVTPVAPKIFSVLNCTRYLVR